MVLVFVFFLSFLAGSFPSAWIVSRILGGGDIRKRGSGNAGATNVLRELGPKAAIPVIVLDVFKGLASVLWIASLSPQGNGSIPGILASAGAMLGHAFPPWLGFRGGKAVATGAGAIGALAPVVVLPCLTVFALLIVATRFVSLGSICASLLMPAVLVIQSRLLGTNLDLPLLAFLCLATALVLFLHRGNIQRLMRGQERKISLPKKTDRM